MNVMKHSISLLFALVLLFSCAFAEEAQDAFTVTIDSSTFSDTWKGKTDEGYQWYITDVTISNWSTTSYVLSDVVQCRLVGQGSYVIDPESDFNVSIVDPFIKTSGHFAFKVPDMIVSGNGGPLTMELSVNGNTTTQVVVDAPETETDSQPQEASGVQLDLAVELSDSTDSSRKKQEAGYVWFEYKVTITNQTSDQYELKEPLVYNLIYKDSFSFAGEADSVHSSIDSFAAVSDIVLFKVPNLVAAAQSGELVLDVEVNGEHLNYTIPQELIICD